MKKIIAFMVTASILFYSPAAFSEEEAIPVTPPPPPLTLNLDLRVKPLQLGETAPFDGVLLTTDAMTKMQYDHILELSLVGSRYEFNRLSLQLRFEAEKSLRLSERTLYETTLFSRLERIQALETLAVSKRPDWVLPVSVLGSFVAGAAITVGITYAVNQP